MSNRCWVISGVWHTARHLAGHKLAITDVRTIRQWAVDHPMSRRQQALYLAPIFGVRPNTISAVLDRESWAWLAQES